MSEGDMSESISEGTMLEGVCQWVGERVYDKMS